MRLFLGCAFLNIFRDMCHTTAILGTFECCSPALRGVLTLGNLYKSGLCHQRLGVSALHTHDFFMKKTGSVAAFPLA